ncbi:hypothetical protein P170DRAFT_130060 [Aspergillus steynii IBT 23096]|uniref:Ankyrin repeat protein n=1 Tax=Aspergillus steynii IBT 23096 TaxID=1392250 RepID=A0A2I2GKN6_9EURO|nr:uncharacterized protein P170DRAFT_130060 [Aspergillus steynii IBT 23096]PLB53435.1 hypothetical protein P170DRAFT_130060 [Aspergillus steynii IBT 23096]
MVERIFDHLRATKSNQMGRPLPSSVDEMSKFIVNFCINFIDTVSWKDSLPDDLASPQSSERSSKSMREIFSETVNNKAVEEKDLFVSFKKKMHRGRKTFEAKRDKTKTGKIKKDEIRQDEIRQDESKKDESKTGSKPKDGHHERQKQSEEVIKSDDTETDDDWEPISKAADLLDEVKDIRDELTILKAILTQQDNIWTDVHKSPNNPKSERRPHYMLTEINEMIEIIDNIKSSVNEILNLEQNGTSLREAFESVQQGRTLMVFTVITIVFTPMSFLSSLFALNVTSFQHDSKGELAYKPSWIFPMLFCISLAITFPLAYLAFYLDNVKQLWKKAIGKVYQQLPETLKDPKIELKRVQTKWDNVESRFRREKKDEEKPPIGDENA